MKKCKRSYYIIWSDNVRRRHTLEQFMINSGNGLSHLKMATELEIMFIFIYSKLCITGNNQFTQY